MRGRRAQVDPPAAELDEHEDIERAEPGGLHGEEVAGHDPARLRPEELGPGGSGPPRGGTESRRPEQRADRRRSDADPELAKLAFDPHTAPPRVLPGEAEDELTDRGIDRWSAWPTGPAIGPLPPHELAVPAEQRRRGDEEGDPAVTRDDPACGGEEDPVDGPELRRACCPLQYPELMAEDEDLEVLGSVVSTRPPSAEEETDEGADDGVEEGQHRPIVPGPPEREIGVSDPHGRWAGRPLPGRGDRRTSR